MSKIFKSLWKRNVTDFNWLWLGFHFHFRRLKTQKGRKTKVYSPDVRKFSFDLKVSQILVENSLISIHLHVKALFFQFKICKFCMEYFLNWQLDLTRYISWKYKSCFTLNPRLFLFFLSALKDSDVTRLPISLIVFWRQCHLRHNLQ